jgi:hypothetical protein
MSQALRASHAKDAVTEEVFVSQSSQVRHTLAYLAAATQIFFWGNLAQLAGSGYAVKDE